MSDIYDVAVIGGGAAGTMAALRSVLNGDRIAFFEGDIKSSKRSRAAWLREVENMPGLHGVAFPVRIQKTSTLRWINSHAFFNERFRRIPTSVTHVEGAEGAFSISYREGGSEKKLSARYVIIATGVMDVQPEIGGSIQPILPYANRGDVIYCIRCDGHRTAGHPIAIIGIDDDMVEIGAILKERYDLPAVSLLTNGKKVALPEETRALARQYGFSMHEEPIVSVDGDPQASGRSGGLKSITLANGERIDCGKIVVCLGLIMHNELLKGLGADLDEYGHASVNDECETSIPGVFVAGDLVAGKKLQIYSAWDTAVDAADEINYRLRMRKRAGVK